MEEGCQLTIQTSLLNNLGKFCAFILPKEETGDLSQVNGRVQKSMLWCVHISPLLWNIGGIIPLHHTNYRDGYGSTIAHTYTRKCELHQPSKITAHHEKSTKEISILRRDQMICLPSEPDSVTSLHYGLIHKSAWCGDLLHYCPSTLHT